MQCSHCEEDDKSLSEVRNSQGYSFAVACDQCAAIFKTEIIDVIAQMHGAVIVDGMYQCSPRGTPDYRSVNVGRLYIRMKEHCAPS